MPAHFHHLLSAVQVARSMSTSVDPRPEVAGGFF